MSTLYTDMTLRVVDQQAFWTPPDCQSLTGFNSAAAHDQLRLKKQVRRKNAAFPLYWFKRSRCRTELEPGFDPIGPDPTRTALTRRSIRPAWPNRRQFWNTNISCFSNTHPLLFLNNCAKSQPIVNDFWYTTSWRNLHASENYKLVNFTYELLALGKCKK